MTSGNVSLFYYEDDQVKAGLPILPELFCQKSVHIKKSGVYACSFCGQVEKLQEKSSKICPNCQHTEWVEALKSRRVT